MLFLWMLAPSTTALAQSASERREAKMEVETGMDHYRAGEYREAVKAFRRAFTVIPDPGLTWNIARSYEELGDITNAVHYFEVFLKRYPIDRAAEEAKDKLAVLRPKLPGTLTVKCGDARAANVEVGGAKSDDAQCGVKIGPLAPGVHPVTVRWGKKVWEGEAKVEASGHTDVEVDWSEATVPKEETAAVAAPPPHRRRQSAAWTTKDWIITGAVLGGALVAGAGIAYAVTQPDRVEVPNTTLGERTVLQE